ncbi:peptidyl-prolyl cis-trans isomerase B-like [Saccoglossus kowalevskii]|uniref:Peptidyl-prolyl cis-trans isomerase n=1 Tax=Saccoglossus kowalevskii TaxID=10224 RepID=A0ABM0GXY7_SACKO|nr:PREDICTED: peptidyl-prolyl cis-trans isomerase B-like [Saccoglossus kowalevskii]
MRLRIPAGILFAMTCAIIPTQGGFQAYQKPQYLRKKTGRDTSRDLLVTKKAWFDIEVDGKPAGRIVIGLFCETVPVTCQNFAALARGNWRNDEKFGYKNTIIHRIVQDFVIQAGDITVGDGSGGKSIYGPYFMDENFYLSHNGPGWVSMANSGPDTNNSQFFITLNTARWLDGQHVVFGKVIEGMDVLYKLGDLQVTKYAFPKKTVRFSDTGVEHVEKPYVLELPAKKSPEPKKKSK